MSTDAPEPPAGESKKSGCLPGCLIVVGVILLIGIIGGVVTGLRSSVSSSQSSSVSKYDQSWPKSYSNTTCTEWNSDMTAAQQFAAAADMLTGARNKGDGGEGLPPDSMISDFQSGVTTACVVPSMSLAEVGAGLYLTERDRYRP
ncbi:hypothetical protein NY547_03465 [Cnuibacter physcomitrellae]|uniref:hypothetical protein n=1 Tax=Cnuibacter physcomitrellae TaxID=1619308 RepID=UPI002175EBBE|nr:hypothetical protein [Cnuibacter physcomitrellae]MCS5496296.1 hypothetical protein [Cnuibacter physcomitrellae]